LLAEELAKLNKRRQQILAELRGGRFNNRERQLILDIFEAPQSSFSFDEHGQLVRQPQSGRNMLAEIRNLLASEPTLSFAAIEIKQQLKIEPLQDKSFYSALAKLHRLGQIERIGRALYKSGGKQAKNRP
jgi:hypothetical protein